MDVPWSEVARRLCARAISVGADGLIVLKRSDSSAADLEWEFYNSDGSAAEFCGNGIRCAARFAVRYGMVDGGELAIATAVGVVRARVADDSVRVEFDFKAEEPVPVSVNLGDEVWRGFFVVVGVPHFVVFGEGFTGEQVAAAGRRIRFHESFAPQGTNVDFCTLDGDTIFIRTYERGVEAETLACGSGAMAAALVARSVEGASDRLSVVPRSGEMLIVDLSQLAQGKLILEGPAREVYRGELVEPWRDEG